MSEETERFSESAYPPEVVETVLRIGRAEWGQTFAHDAAGHAEHIAESVSLTAKHYSQEGPQHMHGLYAKGTEVVICHAGTSPNSPQIARALTGAWNRLVAECEEISVARERQPHTYTRTEDDTPDDALLAK